MKLCNANRFRTAVLVAVITLFANSNTMASDFHEPFSQERFETLQAEGAVVMVEVWASWCSTCRAQVEVLEKLAEEEAFSEIHMLRIDWDEQREKAQALDAWRQSTLILYKGEHEMARVVAETREPALRYFLESAL